MHPRTADACNGEDDPDARARALAAATSSRAAAIVILVRLGRYSSEAQHELWHATSFPDTRPTPPTVIESVCSVVGAQQRPPHPNPPLLSSSGPAQTEWHTVDILILQHRLVWGVGWLFMSPLLQPLMDSSSGIDSLQEPACDLFAVSTSQRWPAGGSDWLLFVSPQRSQHESPYDSFAVPAVEKLQSIRINHII